MKNSTKGDAPLVSVALCTYNGAKFLNEQLDSILSQSYRNLEIVIVDDGSKDNTWQILEEYAISDDRIRLHRNKHNLGYTANFARAIELCSGDFIALSDQDDIWEPAKIAELRAAIQDNILVYHNSDFINDNDERINDDTVASVYRLYDGTSCLPFIMSNCVHGHAVMFKRELTKFLFPFNKKYPHDWWLAYVAFNVGSVKYVDKILVHYRQHQHSITDTFSIKEKEISTKTQKVKGWRRIPLDLELVKYVSEFKYNRNPELMTKVYRLLSRLVEGRAKLQSFWFLVKYFDLLFYLRYPAKSLPSKINMVRKICFN